jgi:hypothetical protein
MRAQDTANHVVINLDAESQRDLLGNAGSSSVPSCLADPRAETKTTCGTFVSLARCGDAAELQASERWQNEEGGTGP